VVAKRCAAQQAAGSRRSPDCVEAVRAQPRARSQVYSDRIARRRRILNLTASMALSALLDKLRLASAQGRRGWLAVVRARTEKGGA
jgi:hypothetical protein